MNQCSSTYVGCRHRGGSHGHGHGHGHVAAVGVCSQFHCCWSPGLFVCSDISDTITIHPEVFLTQAKDVSVLEELPIAKGAGEQLRNGRSNPEGPAVGRGLSHVTSRDPFQLKLFCDLVSVFQQ